MLLLTLFQSPILFITIIVALLACLTIHEAAHAYASSRLGDETARMNGRLSLNPFAHLDPIGSILLLVVGFGWGKPVPVNPRNLKDPIKDELLIALAGPVSNLLLAILLGLLFRLFGNIASEPLQLLILITGHFSLLLMLFNLIPIPPLDGSKILQLFIPPETWIWLQQYGFILLFFLIFVPIGSVRLLDIIISGPTNSLFILFFNQGFIF